MTNPDNIVRVRARNGGRASVYEANGWAQAYTSGLLEGNGVLQNTSADMNVLVGGSTTKPDVVLAQNASGYEIALDLVGQQAVAITAPASNSRISAIVAYTDDLSLSTTEDTVTGSPASCGLIVVNGTAASSPSEPTDSQIRTAITADGATGSQASYCVIATILVASNTTIITNDQITNKVAGITSKNVDLTTLVGYTEEAPNVELSQTLTTYATVDLSKIPDGKEFVAFFTVAATGTTTTTGLAARTNYNGVNGPAYTQTAAWGKSVCGMNKFTKIAGVDSLDLMARKDNSSNSTISYCACMCYLID